MTAHDECLRMEKRRRHGQDDGRKGNEKKYRTERPSSALASKRHDRTSRIRHEIELPSPNQDGAKLDVIGFCAKFDHPRIILK